MGEEHEDGRTGGEESLSSCLGKGQRLDVRVGDLSDVDPVSERSGEIGLGLGSAQEGLVDGDRRVER